MDTKKQSKNNCKTKAKAIKDSFVEFSFFFWKKELLFNQQVIKTV